MERATPPTGSSEAGARRQAAGSEPPAQVARDWRAVIVAGGGVFAIVVIVIVATAALPDGRAATGSESVVAIASAAVTAIGTVVSAYFGIRAANIAREESTKAVERGQIYASELAGASPEDATTAGERADERIRNLGLSATAPGGPSGRRRR